MNRNLLHGLSWLIGFLMCNLIWVVGTDVGPVSVVGNAFGLLCVCAMFAFRKLVEIQEGIES
jgi:nicotinamide riboside transporter PnuC